MPITKVWIEENCTSCGLCTDLCPEVFVMKDQASVVQNIKYSDYEERIKEAAEICPVQVIRYVD